MNHAQSLSDDTTTMSPSIGGSIGGGSLPATMPPIAQEAEAVPPMPTDTFTPLPGSTPTKSRCCGKTTPAPTIVNVNVNAGNNNGNNNGGGRPSGSGTPYTDTMPVFDQQRVVEKIVEKPVYKPIVMIREIIRKIKEYVPMKQVYERQVGQPYDDQPLSFEGSAQRATTKVAAAPTPKTTTPTPPTATTTTGAVVGLPVGILPSDGDMDNATISQTLPRP